MHSPFLSVIVPCLNLHAEVRELLAQLDEQVRHLPAKIEVVVVDDGSQPPLPRFDISSRLLLKTIRNDRTLGAPAARRAGLQVAKGQVIHFHDADDLFGPQWLRLVTEAFLSEGDLDTLITSRAVQAVKGGNVVMVHSKVAYRFQNKIDRLRRYQLLQNAIGPLGGVVFRAGIITPDDFWNAPASQDWLMYDAALSRASKLRVRPDIYFVHRTYGRHRIGSSARRRVKGYVYASRIRFRARWVQRAAAILYCATAKDVVMPVVRVRGAPFLRFICRHIALSRLFGSGVVARLVTERKG